MHRLFPLSVALALLATLAACSAPGPVQHVNPEGMHANAAFSQAVTVDGPHRVIYVGGQNAIDGKGQVVGTNNISDQAVQVARNLRTVLEASGAGIEHVVQFTVYIVDGQPHPAAFAGFQREVGTLSPAPTVSVVTVVGLAHPSFLLEVSAIAVVPVEE
jgi:enamine deaminase RidA (YjgF/YER057c/UK114 family)